MQELNSVRLTSTQIPSPRNVVFAEGTTESVRTSELYPPFDWAQRGSVTSRH